MCARRPDRGRVPAPGARRDARHRWRALAVCLVAAFMVLLDVSIVNVALPSIRTGLDAGEDRLQWILSGYALTFGLVLVPAGRLGDMRGRRGVFMAGLVLFTAASAAAGLAPDSGWLVTARLVQGIAGGICNPQIAGFIQQLFQGAERGRAFGALGATIGVATAVGPLVGGALITLNGPEQGWRWVFFVNVPVGLAALPLAWRLLPPTPRQPRQRLDPVGVLLLGSGLVCLLLPFVQAQQWPGATKWLFLPVAAMLLAGFVGWERRHPAPIVDLRLFRMRSYGLGALLALVYFAGFTGIFFIFTLYLQNGLRYSALLAGLAITPFAVGSGIAATIGGRLVSRYGRPLVAAGLVVVAAGLAGAWVTVAAVPGREAAWAGALPLLVAGIGSGLVIAPNQTITLSRVPVAQGGSAAGVLQTGQRVGTAVGVAAVGSVFFAAVVRTRGDWSVAFRDGLLVILGFVLVALCVAVYDMLRPGGTPRPADGEGGRAPRDGDG